MNARDVLNLEHSARYNVAEKTQRKLRRSNIEVMFANVKKVKLSQICTRRWKNIIKQKTQSSNAAGSL